MWRFHRLKLLAITRCKKLAILSLVGLCTSVSAKDNANHFVLAQTIDVDFLASYEYQVFQLALDKTKQKYGDYTLSISKNILSEKRAEIMALSESGVNIYFIDSASIERSSSLAYARFPVMLGIVGYRVNLMGTNLKSKGYAFNSVEDLKSYTFIQGAHWLDSTVLKDNGFNVLEGASIEGLFNMLSYERADFFPVAANQVKDIVSENIELEGVSVEENFMFYYPLPRFIYTHKRNRAGVERLHEGLIQAFDDGSLIELWYKHNKTSLDFVGFDKRLVFKLKNKHLGALSDGLDKYIYPFQSPDKTE